MNWLLVIAGAVVGAPLRYLTDRAVQARHDSRLPVGHLRGQRGGQPGARAADRRRRWPASAPAVTALLGTGLCGALTTYSTFSYETLRLAERGRAVPAVANVAASVLVGSGCGVPRARQAGATQPSSVRPHLARARVG